MRKCIILSVVLLGIVVVSFYSTHIPTLPTNATEANDSIEQSESIGTNIRPESALKPTSKTEIFKYKQIYIPKESQDGSCWTVSNATSNDKAWRCMVKNNIYDPCFETDSKQIVCDVYPEKQESGFELKLTETLPDIERDNGAQEKLPFWVELENGKFCIELSKSISNTEALLFSCGEGKENVVLVGDDPFDTSTPMWRAKVGYLSDDWKKIIKTEFLNVVKAWR